jgi:tRNA pseudouridine55 synthase
MTILNQNDYSKIPLVFNVYKPVGLTSVQTVWHFKKNLSFDYGKIGHFGTLDPFAEGVLLVGIQGAQKLNNYVHEYLSKTYEAVGVFGVKTFSGDLLTKVIEQKEIADEYKKLSLSEMEALLKEKFEGVYWQAPHAVSAAKFEGRRLYELALAGKIIKKEKVKREILSFKLLEYNYPELKFHAEVSSGTYIRSLFEEIAELLNGVGALKSLKRTAIGNINSKNSIMQTDWPIKHADFNLKRFGTTLDELLPLNNAIIKNQYLGRYLQGQKLSVDQINIKPIPGAIHSQNIYWAYSEGNFLVGLSKIENNQVSALFTLKEAIALFSSTS